MILSNDKNDKKFIQKIHSLINSKPVKSNSCYGHWAVIYNITVPFGIGYTKSIIYFFSYVKAMEWIEKQNNPLSTFNKLSPEVQENLKENLYFNEVNFLEICQTLKNKKTLQSYIDDLLFDFSMDDKLYRQDIKELTTILKTL